MLALGIVILLVPTVWTAYILTVAALSSRERRNGGAL